MEISQTLLALMFSVSVGVGALLGVVYDVFRFVRVALLGSDSKLEKVHARLTKGVAVFVHDALFCIICAVSLLLLLYYTNDGQFRGIAVIGMLAGFFVYRNTFGKLLVGITDRLAKLVRAMFLLPFKLLWSSYKATLGRVMHALHTKIIKIKDEKYTANCTDRYRASAERGFGIAVFDKNTDGLN